MGPSKARLLAALAAVLLWSTNAYAADLALSRMSLGWLLVVQYSTAAMALLAVGAVARLRAGRASSTTREAHTGAERGRLGPSGLLIGVVGLTGTTFLQYLAFATAPIVAANVLAYAWPLLAAVWVATTRRSRHALLNAGLAVIGFGGVALIFTSPSQTASGISAGSSATWGYLAALGSAACMAIYTLGASRMTTTPVGLLVPATLTGTAGAVVLTILSDGQVPTGTGVLAAAYIGLGPMAAGYALWTRGMSRGGGERLSPLGYATALLSTVLLLAAGATATASTLTGVGLVLACSLGVLAHHGRRTTPQPEQSDRPVPCRRVPIGEARGYRDAMDFKLELVTLPVTDVGRAISFYVDQVGFNADIDIQVTDELRFVQLTPPGSACSIMIGTNVTDMTPGSQQGLQVVVADIEAAREHLVGRGVETSEVDTQDWGSFVYFSDPDGNTWSVQQLPERSGDGL